MPGEHFDNMEQVLSGLERTSGHLATTLNLPPVNAAGLRRDWEKLKTELASIPPDRIPALSRLEHTWADLRRAAEAEHRSVLTVSTLMAISTLAHVPQDLLWLSKTAVLAARRTTCTVGGPILDHYSEALEELSKTGFLNYWAREFRPYLRAAAGQFALDHESMTERLLETGKLSSRKSPPQAAAKSD